MAMSKKIKKITKTKEFDKIFKQGVSSFSPLVLIKKQKNNLNINRCGIVVSTKVSSKAVIRNKTKRVIRESFKEENKKMIQGNDYVFIAQKDIKDKSYQEVLKSVQQQLNKLKSY
jgi:ribonuclease P protein component